MEEHIQSASSNNFANEIFEGLEEMSLGVHDRDQANSDGNFGSVGKDLFAVDGAEDFGNVEFQSLSRDMMVKYHFPNGKASSMVAPALSPEPGWEVLDACAAPGNKTVHLAALMKRKGRIIACELRKERIKRLKETIKLSGASKTTIEEGSMALRAIHMASHMQRKVDLYQSKKYCYEYHKCVSERDSAATGGRDY